MNLASLQGSSPDILTGASEFSCYLAPASQRLTGCPMSLKTDPLAFLGHLPLLPSFPLMPLASLSASCSTSFSVAHPPNVGVLLGSILSNLLFNIFTLSG